ncbi:MAG: hypothetical protein R2879_00620 [Saprospiraceae bacterium]
MKKEILNKVISKINKLQNILCSVVDANESSKDKLYDAIIKIETGSQKVKLKADVKSKIVPAQVPKLIDLKKEIDTLIVIANYITPKAKEILKEKQIAYADPAGNIFISTNSIYIYVEGKAPQLDELESKSRAFTPAGLKVVFQFLINPEFLNYPYRFIGERATVTIRTVERQ